MGRPSVEINWKEIDALCSFHATSTMIIDYLDAKGTPISRDTFDRRCKESHGCTFADYVNKRVSGLCKMKLSQLQWKSAEAGNVSMQIWLGKQHLGQSDTKEQDREAGSVADALKDLASKLPS